MKTRYQGRWLCRIIRRPEWPFAGPVRISYSTDTFGVFLTPILPVGFAFSSILGVGLQVITKVEEPVTPDGSDCSLMG